MPNSASINEPTLGFVTITHDVELGHLGGYLLLNARARPLEFHCTAPVQPSRAQEILYGATLKSYLYGEQIAGALISRAKIAPDLLLCDIPEIAEARPLPDVPTLLLTCRAPTDERDNEPQNREEATEAAVAMSGSWGQPFLLGDYCLAVRSGHAPDRERAERFWRTFGDGLALDEPFVRIREAIQEAQRPAKAA